MTCHLSKRAVIGDFKAIRNLLQFDCGNEIDAYSAEAWNNSWEDDFQPTLNKETLKFDDDTWLQECVTSLSPTLDILALAHRQNAVILSSKWDGAEESNIKLKFTVSFEGSLTNAKNETVTSILCLPFASQKKSSQGGPDWTCIIVGFSSGYVRIYTEKAELLFSQLLHEEPVYHLKCKTHTPQHFPNYADHPEELVIVYSSVVVTIDGFGLFQTLRACRNQLARVTAGKQEVTQPPPLSYKKWGFQEHEKLADCEAVGTVSLSQFDHLVNESIRKGFYGAVRTNVPLSSLILISGYNPCAGFYHASEGSSQLLLTDVVQAVASKLFNFITHSAPGGLIGGLIGHKESEVKRKPKIEPPSILSVRFGIYDKRRQGLSITLSPNKALAAIADAFGRVILFDVNKGVAVRMWKGYRDAQCGWVEVEDELQTKEVSGYPERKKRAFFLVIYAPRRGILEVWCSQQGPRVAAFNVGKSGRLLYSSYAMFGSHFSGTILPKYYLSSCYFLDNDGFLKKIYVPFHLTLSERSSKRVRDLHLLKELRTSLKNISKGKAIDIIKILKDIRTSNIKIQALDSLFSSRHSTAELVEEIVSALISHFQRQDAAESDYETKVLMQSCVRALQLVRLYKTVSSLKGSESASPVISSSRWESFLDIQLYANSLCVSETEVGRIFSYVTLHQTVSPAVKKHVRFSDDEATDLSFADFMSYFNVTDYQLQKVEHDILMKNLHIDLKKTLPLKQMDSLGGFLFHHSIYIQSCLSSLQTALKDSCILPEKLLHLLLQHWMSNSEFYENADKWLNLQQALKHISSMSDPKSVYCDSDRLSPWWSTVRDILMKSTSCVPTYIAAVIARSVSIIMAAAFRVEQKNTSTSDDKMKSNGDKGESGDSDWESISLDVEHWNMLVKQLEDIVLLNTLLRSQPFDKVVPKEADISISHLLSGGQGKVTDYVAVWAVSSGLTPELFSFFLMNESNEQGDDIPQKLLDDSKGDIQVLHTIKGLLAELRKKFPYSLNYDILMSNYAWEHLMQWNKNKDETIHLMHCLRCFDLIQSSVVKNGFASMMWKSCMQKKFEALALLIEKVGKTPKERLCRKELEMNDSRLEGFLNFCCQLLLIILETSSAAEVEEIPKYQCEELWQDRECHGSTPLVLMALGQKVTNKNSVFQHFLLSTVLHVIVSLQLKNSRPLGMFTVSVRKAFFRELHFNLKETGNAEDPGLQATRRQFLIRAVTAIAQSVPDSVPENDSDTTDGKIIYRSNMYNPEGARLANKWFNKLLDLSREWNLNLDELRRHYVCELYSGGCDSLAEELMPTVSDVKQLGSQLLLICGRRVYSLIYESPNLTNKLGYLTPGLSSWLKNLDDKKLRCNNVPDHITLNMVNHVLRFLPEHESEHRLAVSLHDTVRIHVEVSRNIAS